jgi:hypothetical protein
MLKKKELKKKFSEEQEGQEEPKKDPKKLFNKVKIQLMKVNKLFSSNTMMVKSNNIIDHLLFRDGMALIIKFKYFHLNSNK